MELIDQFRYLVGGYYGMMEMDEYELKVYVLKDIENYIRAFIHDNPISDFDYKEEARKVADEVSLITKLQDCLLVLYKIDAPMEVVLLVKARLKREKENLQTSF